MKNISYTFYLSILICDYSLSSYIHIYIYIVGSETECSTKVHFGHV
uniref:Uncharacterized protein n=1 Tax=Lepeophtheirus salmonis TaxID=72036 RepID=A0A0K2UDB2_LEPSM